MYSSPTATGYSGNCSGQGYRQAAPMQPAPSQASPQYQQPQNQPNPNQQVQSHPTQSQPEFFNRKIVNRFGMKKVIDFNDCLIAATPEDYANIHGRGGKNHNPNSTIGIVICDSSKGSPVTVSAKLNVRDIPMVYQAVMAVRLGTLGNSIQGQTVGKLAGILTGIKAIPKNQDGTRSVPSTLLAEMDQLVSGLSAAGNFSYVREKNNPYMVENGYAPVSRLTINHTPCKPNGEKSAYPWYIEVTDFKAPIQKGRNGTTMHKSTQAKDVRRGFINLSTEDFLSALESVLSYIRVWEDTVASETVRNRLQYMEGRRKEGNM